MHFEKVDRERLARISDFLSEEMKDFKNKFLNLDYKNYKVNSDIRRNIERCIENIVNASLDIAKIILVNEEIAIPETYREYFLSLSAKNIIGEDIASILADGVRIRNILAHQYLDIRWNKIESFIKTDWKAYETFLDYIKKYLIS
jgi:uncharacterized protein YutE (UPF0331/DUF86 family)